MKPLMPPTFQVSIVKFWDKTVKPTPEQPQTDGTETQNINQLMHNSMKVSKDGMMAGTSFGQSLTEKRLLLK